MGRHQPWGYSFPVCHCRSLVYALLSIGVHQHPAHPWFLRHWRYTKHAMMTLDDVKLCGGIVDHFKYTNQATFRLFCAFYQLHIHVHVRCFEQTTCTCTCRHIYTCVFIICRVRSNSWPLAISVHFNHKRQFWPNICLSVCDSCPEPLLIVLWSINFPCAWQLMRIYMYLTTLSVLTIIGIAYECPDICPCNSNSLYLTLDLCLLTWWPLTHEATSWTWPSAFHNELGMRLGMRLVCVCTL